jgi:peptidyl-prolyl cis-trans isomerase D
MFDTIRNNSKILMGLLVVLIIPSFVLFGVDGYSNMSDRGVVVAKVGDIEITQQECDAPTGSGPHPCFCAQPGRQTAGLS